MWQILAAAVQQKQQIEYISLVLHYHIVGVGTKAPFCRQWEFKLWEDGAQSVLYMKMLEQAINWIFQHLLPSLDTLNSSLTDSHIGLR